MKRILYILIMMFFALHANAQLLYEVSGKSSKQKSYILAINRYVNMQFLDTIPNVFQCFGKCNKVLTEFTMQDYEALAALRQAAVLPDSIRLTNFYTEEQLDYIDQQYQMYGNWKYRASAGDLIDLATKNCSEPWIGLRDKAFFTLLYGCGLRISEAISLNVEDLSNAEFLKIRGKGNKDRYIPILPIVLENINKYKLYFFIDISIRFFNTASSLLFSTFFVKLSKPLSGALSSRITLVES